MANLRHRHVLPMTTLRRLILLTHPMAYHSLAGQAWAQPWIARERAMAGPWLAAIAALGRDELAAVVSAHPCGPAPMEEFCVRAERACGDRCVILRQPDARSPLFWAFDDPADERGCLDDLRCAWTGQGDAWNREEMDTMLHARRGAAAIRDACRRRGLRLDPRRTVLEGWGEEFEGCTLKYALATRRALGLATAPRLMFEQCVPGARMLLRARQVESLDMGSDARAMVFQWRRQCVALFVSLKGTLADGAQVVTLPRSLRGVTVWNKQGGRLWPLPMRGPRVGATLGFAEPVRPLVSLTPAGLAVPVCTGMVYALAKAPALVRAPAGMTLAAFVRHLRRGRI